MSQQTLNNNESGGDFRDKLNDNFTELYAALAAIGSPLKVPQALDASANPNYPAGTAGDTYKITVAGKTGGDSGKVVSVGDMLICSATNAGGTEASVGTSWFVVESNLAGITAAGLDLLTAANAGVQRAFLGLQIGSDVQAYSAERVKLGVRGSDIASASTINLETATGQLVTVTGTTGISTITLSDGHVRIVRFSGALTLNHVGNLELPGAAAITTAAGDVAVFAGFASSVVRCISYQRASGLPVVSGGGGAISTPRLYHANSTAGNDTTGDGSLSSPYATAQKAYDVGVAAGNGFCIQLWYGTAYTITDLSGFNSLCRHIRGMGVGAGWNSSLTHLTISTKPADVSDTNGTNAAGIFASTDDMDVTLEAVGGGVNETDSGTYSCGTGGDIEHFTTSSIVAAYSRGGSYNSASSGFVNGGISGTIKLHGGRVFVANSDYGTSFGGGIPVDPVSNSAIQLDGVDARGVSSFGIISPTPLLTAGRSSFVGTPTFSNDMGGNSVGWS